MRRRELVVAREEARIERRRRDFAAWLRGARHRAHLTQEELSVKVDRSQSAVAVWESAGLEIVTPEEIKALATALDVEPVEVADALGYPTRPRAVSTLPLSADEWFQQVAELGDRVQQVQREWAADLYPPHSAEHGQNGRNG